MENIGKKSGGLNHENTHSLLMHNHLRKEGTIENASFFQLLVIGCIIMVDRESREGKKRSLFYLKINNLYFH